MDRCTVYMYLSHNPVMPWMMFRNFQWTMKYGLNDITPPVLTTLALIFAGNLEDFKGSAQLLRAALQLLPRVSPLMRSRTLFLAHAFSLLWTEPYEVQLKPLIESLRDWSLCRRQGERLLGHLCPHRNALHDQLFTRPAHC